jgi:hypothetical protein
MQRADLVQHACTPLQMELQAETQQVIPKLGRIMRVSGDAGGLTCIISSILRAKLATQAASQGEVFDLDATGSTVRQLAGRVRALVQAACDGAG